MTTTCGHEKLQSIMEIGELTSDDDSFEIPVSHPKKSVPRTTGPKEPTTSQHFRRLMISLDSFDDEPKQSPTKLIGLGPEDPAYVPVSEPPKSQEDNDLSSLKKRPSTSITANETKKRSIDFDGIGDAMTIGGPSPDACNPMVSTCGSSGGGIGQSAPIVTHHHRLEIAGDFPLTPYPAQKAMML